MQLESLVRRTVRKEDVLHERARLAEQTALRLSKEIGEIDMLLNRKDELLNILNHLQHKAQAQNVGMFESILTALVQEVMPGKVDKVVLSSRMKNNRASLEIDAISGGKHENIYKSKGGSISNIVAMGLRFIVLMRHPNRRVLFLDEADCHIKETYIPAFSAFMQQLSQKLGIQVVYISHSPAHLFAGNADVVELYRPDKTIFTRTIHPEPPPTAEYEKPESAIRYLRLKGYGPHLNTLIELSPRVTIITGDNDIGKSHLIKAVGELIENDGDECRIDHDSSHFEIELGIEDGMSIYWRYQRTGKQKTLMELRDGKGIAIEKSDSGMGVPDWLHTYLAMAPVNGENINIHSQTKQNYILSNDYTSTQRAQMLPLGRNSRDVHAIIQDFNERLVMARQSRRSLEKELNIAHNELAIMSLIIENPADSDAMLEQLKDSMAVKDRLDAMGATLKRLEVATERDSTFKEGIDLINKIKCDPVELQATSTMSVDIAYMRDLEARDEAFSTFANLGPAGAAPELNDLSAIAKTGSRLRSLMLVSDTLAKADNLKPGAEPEVKFDADLKNILGRIEVKEAGKTALDEQGMAINKELKAIDSELKALIEELGGVCPTCTQPMGDHSHE